MSIGHPIFVVRSTGIEDVRRYEKSLDYQGFFAIERQRGRQKIRGHYINIVIFFSPLAGYFTL